MSITATWSEKTTPQHNKKHLHCAPSHKEVYLTRGNGELCSPEGVQRNAPYGFPTNFGRDVVFSADLRYNEDNEKEVSLREGVFGHAHVSFLGWALPDAFVIQRRNLR